MEAPPLILLNGQMARLQKTVQALAVGNYKVTVTDAAGCSTQLNISVFKKPIQVSATVNQPKCSGELGSITLTPATGGVPPYTYSWSNGETTTSIDELIAGTYSCNDYRCQRL